MIVGGILYKIGFHCVDVLNEFLYCIVNYPIQIGNNNFRLSSSIPLLFCTSFLLIRLFFLKIFRSFPGTKDSDLPGDHKQESVSDIKVNLIVIRLSGYQESCK